jgi:hypothetical protein
LPERSGKLVDGPLLQKPYLRGEFARMVRKTMSENLQFGRYAESTAPAGPLVVEGGKESPIGI